jgi:hypothetical protein
VTVPRCPVCPGCPAPNCGGAHGPVPRCPARGKGGYGGDFECVGAGRGGKEATGGPSRALVKGGGRRDGLAATSGPLPRRDVGSQRVVNPWSGSKRVTVVDAEFERLPARPTGQAAADRVTLWLVADDGEGFAPQQVYLHARYVCAAVFGDIPPTAWLETEDSGTALAQALIGRELEVVIPPGKTRASRMRRVGGHRL